MTGVTVTPPLPPFTMTELLQHVAALHPVPSPEEVQAVLSRLPCLAASSAADVSIFHMCEWGRECRRRLLIPLFVGFLGSRYQHLCKQSHFGFIPSSSPTSARHLLVPTSAGAGPFTSDAPAIHNSSGKGAD